MKRYFKIYKEAAEFSTKVAFAFSLLFLIAGGILFYRVSLMGWDNPAASVKSALMGSCFGLGIVCFWVGLKSLSLDLLWYQEDIEEKIKYGDSVR